MAKVSVLLPNYNNGPYLKEALESVFNQTFKDFVVYFVDDCSTDNSIEVAQSFTDDRLHIIRKEANSGIVDTLNRGLDQVETPYIIRMDGDDVSAPNRFEKLVNFMEQHPEVGVCSSAIRQFGESSDLVLFEKDAEMNKAHLIFVHSVGHASSIFRTEVFKQNNVRYRNRFWRMEDYDLFYELKDLTQTTSIDDELYFYRRGAFNNNPEINRKKEIEFRKFYRMISEDLGMEITDKGIDLHVQLNNRSEPTYTVSDYADYVATLKKANARQTVFPPEQLGKVLDKQLEKMVFKLIEKRKLGVKEMWPLRRKYPSALTYLLRMKLRRILGRK